MSTVRKTGCEHCERHTVFVIVCPCERVAVSTARESSSERYRARGRQGERHTSFEHSKEE